MEEQALFAGGPIVRNLPSLDALALFPPHLLARRV